LTNPFKITASEMFMGVYDRKIKQCDKEDAMFYTIVEVKDDKNDRLYGRECE